MSRATRARLGLGVVGLIGLIGLIGAGCQDGTAEATATDPCGAPKHVILFVDHSASASRDDLTQGVIDSIARLPQRYLTCPGDRMQLFALHKRTRGRAIRLDLVSGSTRPEQSRPKSQAERIADSLEAHDAQQRRANEASERILAFIANPEGPPPVQDSTDILGSLEVAAEEFADAPPGREQWIIYFSDMFESMSPPGRRDFDSRPPLSISEAEAWAAHDFEHVIPTMRIDPSVLAAGRIRIFSHPWGNRRGSEFVRSYWTEVFVRMGIPRSHVTFE